MKNTKCIAVDFDGTLCYSNWPHLGSPNIQFIEFLKAWRQDGNKLILWTCRDGEALENAVEWCHNQDLSFDAINDNLPEFITMFGNNSRKISCDYYIDDKSISLAELQNKCYGGTTVE